MSLQVRTKMSLQLQRKSASAKQIDQCDSNIDLMLRKFNIPSENPKCILIEFFRALINEIELGAENKLYMIAKMHHSPSSQLADCANEASDTFRLINEKINLIKIKMHGTIKLYEKECMANYELREDQYKLRLIKIMQQLKQSATSKSNSSNSNRDSKERNRSASNSSRQLDKCIFEFKKDLFLNKMLLFKQYKQENENPSFFGALISFDFYIDEEHAYFIKYIAVSQ
jgi:hypothetical protein